MLHEEERALLEAIEFTLVDVLTLTEGLTQSELARSRFTRLEVQRQLLSVAKVVAALGVEAQAAMPELDCCAWKLLRARLLADAAIESEAAWFAIQTLAPATIGWLRVYRSQPKNEPLAAT